MAVDYNTILKSYFGGDGVVLSWPIPPVQPFGKAYRPLETLPADIQELFVFNPDKSKQLLKEAVYPNGFKIKVLTTSANVDYLSIIKDYWQKLGVDMQIDVRDTTVFNSIANNRTHEEAIFQGGFPAYIRLGTFMGDNAYNLCMINDPFYAGEADKMQNAYFTNDQATIDHVYGDEVIPYVLRQVYAIDTPASYVYIFWQPWIKNLNGAIMCGWTDSSHTNYIWIDQKLKAKMGR
jgi:ABC-type transport system substrate-binding protein